MGRQALRLRFGRSLFKKVSWTFLFASQTTSSPSSDRSAVTFSPREKGNFSVFAALQTLEILIRAPLSALP
jgi:hypothetical protein